MDLQPDQLRTLVAVVDHGTLDAAARHLRLTPSAISQRLKALESSVGQVLLRRTKPVQVTEPGQIILRMARQLILLSDDAELALGGGVDGSRPATLPIAINGDSLNTWALEALANAAADAQIFFEVHRADEAQSTQMLRNGTVMAAVTSVAEPVQGCTVRKLGTMNYRPMAGPAFAEQWFSDGPTLEALAVAPMVAFDRVDQLQDRYLRRKTRRRIRPPRHYIPVSADFARAISLGLGWGMIPPQQSAAMEAADALVEIDPEVVIRVPLYWQQWKLHSPMLAGVADAVAETAAYALKP